MARNYYNKDVVKTTTTKGMSWGDKRRFDKQQKAYRKSESRQQRADNKYRDTLAQADLAKQRNRMETIRSLGNAFAKNVAAATVPTGVNRTLHQVNTLVNPNSSGSNQLKSNQKRADKDEEDKDQETTVKTNTRY